ncbi:MAG: FkbM family methyltransferase [Proteobacteria bacterium]|nr:FkbM family methyltransferase [Pseudomonadota bacterium]
MNKKYIYGWWLPKEDQHFEGYFSQSVQVGDKRLYQPQHIDRCFHHIKNRKHTAIDVGGHCGFWSFYLGGNFKKVYAFEPVEIFRECFKKNIPHGNVELLPVALGNENGFVSMNIELENTGATHISSNTNDLNKVELKKLDDYELTDVDFIKIDVEGYENKVVLGAKETLLRNKPIIIVEQKGFSDRFNETQFEAVDTLKSYGAKVIDQVVKDYILSW